MTSSRRFPVGAEVVGDSTSFRVWAPHSKRVEVLLREGNEERYVLDNEQNGYFTATIKGIGAGTQYWFVLDAEGPFPDPASRFQPNGPHGASQVVNPQSYHWTDDAWRGVKLPGQVFYEMHVGTYTRAGSWQAAAAELQRIAELGITAIEVMPVAEFAGHFGWGYDGVDLFAPTHLYGSPDDFRDFVNTAHALGLGVLLDVVYNHLGPDGNYLGHFAPEYFTDRYKCEWGDAINFDGPLCSSVREFFVSNAAYWISEFHLDGLRLDATQQIFDASEPHIIAEISSAVRRASRVRHTLIIAENEPQDRRVLEPREREGFGLDAVWNDDFHHSARVAVTGRREAYYTNHYGSPQELISAAKYGYLYQGQYYPWQRKRRGTPTTGIRLDRFVVFIQNHDQVANSTTGARLHDLTSAGRYRAITTLLLLMPGTPMIFQGQEFAASAPFLYFADHKPEIAALVKRGRFDFLKQFRSVATPDAQAQLADPEDPHTFEMCKLDLAEREQNEAIWLLHRDLLRLRAELQPLPLSKTQVDGAVLGSEALLLRYFAEPPAADHLLIVNLGA
jgi:maltooligosyltrehalose trehalohydrolase